MRFGRRSRDVLYADAVAYLCLNLAEVRDAVGDAAWETKIRALLDAKPFSEPWVEALRALHDAAAAEEKIPGGLGLGSTMGGGFPGKLPEHSAGWVCPDGHCRRVVLRGSAGGQVPPCELSGKPMRLVE